MRLIKDTENIQLEDREIALKIINRLKMGDRVFGCPAEGLKKTLTQVEKQLAAIESSRGKLDYLSDDAEMREQMAKLKAGITGEEGLAEWMETVVKYDDNLQDIITFASLSDPEQNSGGDDYISDSDFVAVYGNHILIMDAKNIPTNPEIPIFLDGNMLEAVGGKEILELHPSVHIWKRMFSRLQVPYLSVHGCVVIVNSRGACVWRNGDWHVSDVQPLHISELVDYLHEWVEKKDSSVNLSLLVALSKMQIRKEESKLDLRTAMREFKI